MKSQNQLVVFRLGEQGYAISLSVVEKVVRAVEITVLPKSPGIVMGIVNWKGRMIPILNMRMRFGLPVRDIDLADRFIFARTSERTVALVADSVDGVISRSGEDITSPKHIVPGLEYIEGVVKLEDGLLFIHDLDTFLSIEEDTSLDIALKGELD